MCFLHIGLRFSRMELRQKLIIYDFHIIPVVVIRKLQERKSKNRPIYKPQKLSRGNQLKLTWIMKTLELM